MTFVLPPEYQQFIEQLVGAGEYESPDDVVCDSLDLLRAQSLYRRQRLSHLKSQVDAGIEEMRAGKVSPADPMALLEEVEKEFGENTRYVE